MSDQRPYRFELYIHARRREMWKGVVAAAGAAGISVAEWIWRAIEAQFRPGE